jgi:mono/diheme cytochrome c family protein
MPPRLCVSAVKVFLLFLLASPVFADDVERGKQLFALAGGCGCHNMADGTVGSGGREIKTPFGTFYGTNIPSDCETGIGAWTDAEIIAAIRDGDARGKGVEAPVMPYYQFAGMSDADVRALVAYLRTLPPVQRQNREAEVSLPFPRLAYRAWRLLFAPRVTPPAETPTEPLARGRYLVDHVSICGDCHTPMTAQARRRSQMTRALRPIRFLSPRKAISKRAPRNRAARQVLRVRRVSCRSHRPWSRRCRPRIAAPEPSHESPRSCAPDRPWKQKSRALLNRSGYTGSVPPGASDRWAHP